MMHDLLFACWLTFPAIVGGVIIITIVELIVSEDE